MYLSISYYFIFPPPASILFACRWRWNEQPSCHVFEPMGTHYDIGQYENSMNVGQTPNTACSLMCSLFNPLCAPHTMLCDIKTIKGCVNHVCNCKMEKYNSEPHRIQRRNKTDGKNSNNMCEPAGINRQSILRFVERSDSWHITSSPSVGVWRAIPYCGLCAPRYWWDDKIHPLHGTCSACFYLFSFFLSNTATYFICKIKRK